MRAPAAAALAALILAACSTGPVAESGPTLENLRLLRGDEIAPMRVGEFVLAPGKPASMDRVITVRAGTASPPEGRSFARYLGTTLATELKAAGKLDPNAPITVQGQLTRSEAGAGMPNGSAALGATFTVVRNGQMVFEKELTASVEFESHFIGAVAIPQAIDQYTGLYPKLVGTLLADKEFRAAVRP